MNAQTIFCIHDYLTEYFLNSDDPIQPPGIKDFSTIDSAAARPNTFVGSEPAYPTNYLKAAALFHSITNNHSFHNGNKRTALLTTIYYLSEFGLLLEHCSDDELYEFTRQIAAHEICEDRVNEVPTIASWLEKHSRCQQKGDRPLKYKELEEILGRFGFTLKDNGKNIDIYQNDTWKTSVLKRGKQGHGDYDPPYISELRKRLDLTTDYGIDSLRFYGQKGIADELNEFMRIRLNVMERLAKI